MGEVSAPPVALSDGSVSAVLLRPRTGLLRRGPAAGRRSAPAVRRAVPAHVGDRRAGAGEAGGRCGRWDRRRLRRRAGPAALSRRSRAAGVRRGGVGGARGRADPARSSPGRLRGRCLRRAGDRESRGCAGGRDRDLRPPRAAPGRAAGAAGAHRSGGARCGQGRGRDSARAGGQRAHALGDRLHDGGAPASLRLCRSSWTHAARSTAPLRCWSGRSRRSPRRARSCC